MKFKIELLFIIMLFCVFNIQGQDDSVKTQLEIEITSPGIYFLFDFDRIGIKPAVKIAQTGDVLDELDINIPNFIESKKNAKEVYYGDILCYVSLIESKESNIKDTIVVDEVYYLNKSKEIIKPATTTDLFNNKFFRCLQKNMNEIRRIRKNHYSIIEEKLRLNSFITKEEFVVLLNRAFFDQDKHPGGKIILNKIKSKLKFYYKTLDEIIIMGQKYYNVHPESKRDNKYVEKKDKYKTNIISDLFGGNESVYIPVSFIDHNGVVEIDSFLVNDYIDHLFSLCFDNGYDLASFDTVFLLDSVEVGEIGVVVIDNEKIPFVECGLFVYQKFRAYINGGRDLVYGDEVDKLYKLIFTFRNNAIESLIVKQVKLWDSRPLSSKMYPVR